MAEKVRKAADVAAAARIAELQARIDEDLEEIHGLQKELQEAWKNNAALREKLEEALPYVEAVRSSHNGYDAECREAMEGLTEPATPKEAIESLLKELEQMYEGTIQSLQTALAKYKLTYSSEVPTEPGEYHIMDPDGFETIVELKRTLGGILESADGPHKYFDPGVNSKHRFAGPIPKPEDN